MLGRHEKSAHCCKHLQTCVTTVTCRSGRVGGACWNLLVCTWGQQRQQRSHGSGVLRRIDEGRHRAWQPPMKHKCGSNLLSEQCTKGIALPIRVRTPLLKHVSHSHVESQHERARAAN